MKVIKRDGREVDFDKSKIVSAIGKANSESLQNHEKTLSDDEIKNIATRIYDKLRRSKRIYSVEDIQDLIEEYIDKYGCFSLAKRYTLYRYKQSLIRKKNTTDDTILSLIDLSNENIKQENSNKNPTIIPTQRDYMAGEVSKDLTDRVLLPQDIVEADREGIIHFHDKDYFAQHTYNCCLCNLDDMLQNGTVISGTMIEKPHSFSTACTIATQIIAQVASSQYGGQSISLTALAPFVDISRQRIKDELRREWSQCGFKTDENKIAEIAEERLQKEINKGVQTIQYQVETLLTTNGQAPFITVFMYLNEAKNEQEKHDLAMVIEETLNQRYEGVKNEKGVWITPAFPKLIYVLEEDNITEDSKYWYLTKLAAKCSAKRLVPDYISEKVMKKLKEGNCFPSMGCRSFLSPYKENGEYKFYGRFNKGVVTINLVDVALSSGKDKEKFWKIFDERLELCHKALLCRYERLKGTVSDVAPIIWQHGALARLQKGETIDKLLVGGYSSISLGYAGLYECVKYMTGKSHTDPEVTPFALDIMRYMNKKCDEWNEQLDLGFSLYGSPIESTTYKFAKCLQRRFGIIEGITDKNYITNSYHVNVREPIDAFAKLKFESQFQELSLGGAISYIETSNLQNNPEAVLSVMKFIYDNIMYAELNTKSDYCQACGYDGEIEVIEDENGKLIWKCPNCGNTDEGKLNICRRTCGYLGTNFWNQGRTQEIKERYVHLGGNE
jgi:ribonucleoside-triphosphate reductase